METYLEMIFGILAIIGGASGIVSFFDWIKNKKAQVKILASNAEYLVYQDSLVINGKIQVTNERKESIFITDILGLIKEDPSKTSDKKGRVYSKRPSNPVFSPIKIEGGGTAELSFEIVYERITPHPIKRIGIASLLGFLENGVPLVLAKESDFDEKWDQLPLEMKLILHLNGKEIIHAIVGVYSRGWLTDENLGTLNPVHIAQIERDYVFGKKRSG